MKNSIIGIISGFLNGLLGSGGGTIIVPALEIVNKTETHKAHATAIAVILPLSLVSSAVYLLRGELHWDSILYVAVGSIPGSILGASILKKLSSNFLNKLFGLVMISAAVRMLFS